MPPTRFPAYAHREGERREQAHLRRAEARAVQQPGGEPAVVEPAAEGVAEVGCAEELEVGEGEEGSPGDGFRGGPIPGLRSETWGTHGIAGSEEARRGLRAGLQLAKFRLRDAGHVGRGRFGSRATRQANHAAPSRAEQVEDGSPAKPRGKRHEQQRGQRAAEPARGPDQALRPRVLMPRKPPAHHAGRVGVRTSRTDAEQKARANHLRGAPAPACGRGEGRPPERDAGQLQALAGAVAQRAGGDFEQRVGQDVRAQNPAPLRRRQVQVGADAGLGDRDGEAVEKRDGGDNRKQRKNAVALLQRASPSNT